MKNDQRVDQEKRQLLASTSLGTLLVATGTLGLRNVAMAQAASTLTWARPTETTLFDPHASNLATAWNVQHLVYESLVTLDDKLKVVPSLATRWEWQGNSLVFTLRANVKFANGRAMTQDDVVESLERALKARGNPWGLILRNQKGVRKVGNNQVAMDFDGPNHVALHALSSSLVCILPMTELKAGTFDPSKDRMMGTGPFSVESHVSNDRWTLKKNPHYWEAGLPKIDTLVVRTIPATDGRIAALRDGSAQIVSFDASPDAPVLLQGMTNVQSAVQRETGYLFLALNEVAPDSIFKDARVRQAVALAVDRDQIVKLALGGVAEPTQGFTQFRLLDDSKLPLAKRDLRKAKELMAAARTAKTTINLSFRESEAASAVAQVLKQNLAEIGITANLEPLEQGTWSKRVWGSSPSQIDATLSYYSGFSHPLITAHWWAPELSKFTGGHVAVDTEYTEQLTKALTSPKAADAQAALQKAYELISQKADQIPLCVRHETIAWRSDKVTMKPSAMESQNHILAGVERFEVRR